MTSNTFTLIDIPTKAPQQCWSLNPWKTRLVLNYKGLQYKTEWVEYPDIRPRLESVLPPNSSSFAYTSPTIQLPDGTYLMDSKRIAEAIEKLHPEPSIHLDSPVQEPLIDIISRAMNVLEPVYKTHVPRVYLSEPSAEYFSRTRSEALGMSLEQYEKQNSKQEAFAKVAPILKEITELLKKDPSGPFLLGEQASYADFILGGFWLFYKGMGDDVWIGLLEGTGDKEVHEKFLEALSPWSKRNNH